MDPECDAYKQIEAIVSDSLLSQEYEMGHIKNCMAVNPHYIMINPYEVHNDKHIGIYCVKIKSNHSVW